MTFRRPSIMQLSSCLDDFDPNAVPVPKPEYDRMREQTLASPGMLKGAS